MRRRRCHARCYAARYRLLTLVACILRANWPAFVTPAPSLRCLSDFGRVGGQARCRSRGHVLTRRTGLSSYAAAGDGSFPNASRHRPPPAMCSDAARLGQLCLMAAGHQRGTAPLDARNQCGAQKQARRFMPIGYSTTHRSGCSSPTRNQARHKNQSACGFYSAVGTIVPFVASTAGQSV